MSEPKKETVRIVLPPRQSGGANAPISSNPREQAMSNLPVKPVPAPPSSVPIAPGVPKPPSPPAVPSMPKPPAPSTAAAGIPSVPKPPIAPAISHAPSAPKPPISPAAPGPSRPPVSGVGGGIAPQPLKPEAKKETAKVKTGTVTAKLPQATVRMQKASQPVQPGTVSGNITVAPTTHVAQTEAAQDIAPVLGIAALVAALLALAVQIWTML